MGLNRISNPGPLAHETRYRLCHAAQQEFHCHQDSNQKHWLSGPVLNPLSYQVPVSQNILSLRFLQVPYKLYGT